MSLKRFFQQAVTMRTTAPATDYRGAAALGSATFSAALTDHRR
jgi:hypothetical protein